MKTYMGLEVLTALTNVSVTLELAADLDLKPHSPGALMRLMKSMYLMTLV